jgi:hypothetical protein
MRRHEEKWAALDLRSAGASGRLGIHEETALRAQICIITAYGITIHHNDIADAFLPSVLGVVSSRRWPLNGSPTELAGRHMEPTLSRFS